MSIHNRFLNDQAGKTSPRLLSLAGPFLDIEIQVPPLIAKTLTDGGLPIPPPVVGIALVDTGATLTAVHDEALRKLGLNPIGAADTGTAGGKVRRLIYPGRLVCPSQGWTLDLPGVISVDLTGQDIPLSPSPQPVIALLGRNFLERCLLVYNGPGGFWTLALS